MRKCLNCNEKMTNPKFCSIKCQQDYSYLNRIKLWKNGKLSGNEKPIGKIKNFVKRYLREKYNNKCCLCGWSKINPHTGKVPLNADHIDGNYRNSTEKNLRLICWNCDSISQYFGGLNVGSGRWKNYKKRQ